MPRIAFEEAWRRYRRAEPRLPAKPVPVAPRRVAGLAAIADDFDLIVLDAWGVLNLGEEPVPGAPATVAALRRQGKRLMVLSNDAGRDKPAALARHRARGFDFAPAELATGLDLVPELLARLAPEAPLGLIADPPAPLATLPPGLLALADEPADYDRAGAILFLSSEGWTEGRQDMLASSLARHPRPLIVANPDIASPEPSDLTAEPGSYAHRLADATSLSPIFCGKPFPAVYERIRARHPEIAAERILCVGDTLHTDILGGRAAGFRTLLVETGFCRGRDAPALAAESGIWPDFLAPRI